MDDTDCSASDDTASAGDRGRIADPLIKWPANVPLAGIIEPLTSLNPQLGLRRLTGTYASTARAEAADDSDDDLPEYLSYDGTSLDVFEIALPAPAEDDLMVGLTRQNREWWAIDTRAGKLQYGPHRIERTAGGNLFVRPRSWHVDCESNRFAFAYQWNGMPTEQIGRIQAR